MRPDAEGSWSGLSGLRPAGRWSGGRPVMVGVGRHRSAVRPRWSRPSGEDRSRPPAPVWRSPWPSLRA